MLLGDITSISQQLRFGRTPAIKLLHSLIFNSDQNRENRKNLRGFAGFNFTSGDSEFEAKLQSIVTNFTSCNLVTIANVLGLDIHGSTEELAKRILEALSDLEALNQTLVENSDTEIEEFSYEDGTRPPTTEFPTTVALQGVPSHENQTNPAMEASIPTTFSHLPQNFRPAISYQDVEGLIPSFHGNKTENVVAWLQRFDTLAGSFSLTELQKFIYAERALKGLAQLFVRSDTSIKNYASLRNALILEFGQTSSPAQVHRLLAARQCRNNETIMEYFLHMREIANGGHIDDLSLIHYVISGIRDTPQNKAILFGCSSIDEFKRQLRVYTEITQSFRTAPQHSPPATSTSQLRSGPPASKPSKTHCFTCGDTSHKASFCPSRTKGIKCFHCNKYAGHISANCPNRKRQTSAAPVRSDDKINAVEIDPPKTSMLKLIKISDVTIYSLVDTGSPVTLIRDDVYRLIGSPPLSQTSLQLSGFGRGHVHPIGAFNTTLEIDDDTFSTLVHVIEFAQMSHPIIIGTDIITQGTLTCAGTGISLTKSVKPDLFVHTIDICDDVHDIELTHILNKSCRAEVNTLLRQYRPEKTKSTDLKMSILLNDDIPVYQRPRRMSVAEKDIVRKQINQWLDDGIIKPSCSDYASPIVLVPKKDGSQRLCVDYRKLNRKLVKDRFPLPLIDDILDQLTQANVFTSLDLKNGFFHVDIDPNSTKYTAFVTHDGQYEYLKVPFGLSTSPAVFSRYLSCVFRKLLLDGILILYMDDIIIHAKTEAEGLQKLKLVLQTAAEYGLKINFKKCKFLQRKIDFLGYIIENNTIAPSPNKVKVVQNFPEPNNTKQLQSLLGLTGYFRKFIPGYASIARPLSDLLRDSTTFDFGESQRQALQTLKHFLTNVPVLHIFTPGFDIEVHTDASKFGFGAVLMQKADDNQFHPVQYMSKKTTPQEEKLCSYELEVLAVVQALKKFRVYLHGTHFKIVTDCKAFQQTLDKTDLSPKIARWALFLQDFDYEIVHRPATKMQHVDSLSRYPVLFITYDDVTQKIIHAQTVDPFISSIISATANSQLDDYILRNGLLYKILSDRELIVVPEVMQTEIIQNSHAKGHFSAKKTEAMVAQNFFIPNLTRHVQKIVSNCVQCILAARKSGKQEGYLHPIAKGDTPLDTYHIDFLGPLPSTNKNYNHIFTVVDAFTKFVWIYPVKSVTTRDALDKLKLLQTVFGNPRRIISDKAPAFTSTDFADFCAQEKIEHVPITTGVPRGNGQCERIHAILIPILTKLSIDDPTKWYKNVAAVQRIINSTTSAATKYSPFELLIGIKMRNATDLEIKKLLDEEHEATLMKDRHELRDIAKENILQQQERNRKQFNKKRKSPHIYHLGDLVAIQRTQFGSGLKLRIKFFGPYKIIKINDKDRYEVQKVGQHEGPNCTSTSADLMKPWAQ